MMFLRAPSVIHFPQRRTAVPLSAHSFLVSGQCRKDAEQGRLSSAAIGVNSGSPSGFLLTRNWCRKERATLHSVLPTSLLWLRRRQLVDELTDGFKVMLVLLAMHLWMGRHQHIATRIHHQHNVPGAALMSGREAPKSVGCCL